MQFPGTAWWLLVSCLKAVHETKASKMLVSWGVED